MFTKKSTRAFGLVWECTWGTDCSYGSQHGSLWKISSSSFHCLMHASIRIRCLRQAFSPPSHDSTLWSTSTSTTSSHLTETINAEHEQPLQTTRNKGDLREQRSTASTTSAILSKSTCCTSMAISILGKALWKARKPKVMDPQTQSNIRCHRIIPAIIDCQEQRCPFRHPGWENSIPPSRHLWRSYLTFSIQQGTFVALMKSVMSHWREASHLSLTPTALPNLHLNQQWENIQQGQKLEGNMSPGDSAVGWAW